MQNNSNFEAQPQEIEIFLRNLHENDKICFSIAFEACYHKWTRLIIDAMKTRDCGFLEEFLELIQDEACIENNQAATVGSNSEYSGRNFCHTVGITPQGLNQMWNRVTEEIVDSRNVLTLPPHERRCVPLGTERRQIFGLNEASDYNEKDGRYPDQWCHLISNSKKTLR